MKSGLTFNGTPLSFCAMRFEWDEDKAARNLAKHGVAFDDAVDVFDDPLRIDEIDFRYDYGEMRINTIGAVGNEIIFFVTHTDRNGITRLISARPASRKERKQYHGQNN